MKLFLDTANIDEIRRGAELGVVSGVTTNPSLAAKEGGYPFMVGVQFHPEFKSRPNRPHPLFYDFIDVAKDTLREGSQRPLPLDEVGWVET